MTVDECEADFLDEMGNSGMENFNGRSMNAGGYSWELCGGSGSLAEIGYVLTAYKTEVLFIRMIVLMKTTAFYRRMRFSVNGY